jgi:hypothetical protein
MLSNRAPVVFASPETERLQLLEEGNASAKDGDDGRSGRIGPMAKEDRAEVAAEPVFRDISWAS